jgi:hypothetical protein
VPDIPTFTEYLASLGLLTAHADPTLPSPDAGNIKDAADSLAALPEITTTTLATWAAEHPTWVNVLGLAVGLSQEKLKNTCDLQLIAAYQQAAIAAIEDVSARVHARPTDHDHGTFGRM